MFTLGCVEVKGSWDVQSRWTKGKALGTITVGEEEEVMARVEGEMRVPEKKKGRPPPRVHGLGNQTAWPQLHWPWPDCLISQCLSFLFCQTGDKKQTIFGLLGRVNAALSTKLLKLCHTLNYLLSVTQHTLSKQWFLKLGGESEGFMYLRAHHSRFPPFINVACYYFPYSLQPNTTHGLMEGHGS